MGAARMIGSWPASTLHLPAFAPWAIIFLTLAVLSSVLWRTALLRATAIPFAAIGLLGAAAGPSFDLAVAPGGDAAAFRAADGRLTVIARGRNAFAAEQWLRADADGRLAPEAIAKTDCDRLACVGYLGGGRIVSLVFKPAAFVEDCARADIVVSPLYAPIGCAAKIIIDREKLKETGAVTLSFKKDGRVEMRPARAPDENRPWSPAPKRGWGRAVPPPGDDEAGSRGGEEEPDTSGEDSALD
ncbi:MAG: competence protein ComEC, partial [Methylocapsa sp.]|nr:competence protein ComEC [Methylocapsa sp.]